MRKRLPPDRARAYGAIDAFRVDGRTLLVLTDTDLSTGGVGYLYRMVVDLDGGTVAAFRYYVDLDSGAPTCGPNAFAANGTDLGFEVDYSRWDASGMNVLDAWYRLYRARYDAVSTTAVRLGEEHPDVTFGVEIPRYVGLGADRASYVVSGTMSVTQTSGTISVVSATLGLRVGAPFHVGGDVLFGGSTVGPASTVILARSVAGADATRLRTVTGGDLMNFGSDGTTIAWLEGLGYDGTTDTYASISLYSGTYDGELRATLVRALDARRAGNPRIGGGYFVHDEDDTASGHHVYAVYRLTDGLRATFDVFPARAERTLLVTSDEAIFDVLGTLYRVDPRTLAFE